MVGSDPGCCRGGSAADSRKRLQGAVDSDCCLVLLEPLDTPLTRFLGSLPEHRDLFGLSPVSTATPSLLSIENFVFLLNCSYWPVTIEL